MCTVKVVAGGGAIEMDVSKALKEYARTIGGKQQHVVAAFARALEVRRSLFDSFHKKENQTAFVNSSIFVFPCPRRL